jgi:hypothetical protein
MHPMTRSALVLLAGAVVPVLVVARDTNAQQPGKPLIEEVAQAVGGRDRILAVRTLVLEGTGEAYSLGQNPSPEAPLPVSRRSHSTDLTEVTSCGPSATTSAGA